MTQLFSKNNYSSLCYDVIITAIKKIFLSGIDYDNKTDVFRNVIWFIINQIMHKVSSMKRSALVLFKRCKECGFKNF